MVALTSSMLPLGTKLSSFELKNYNNKVDEDNVCFELNGSKGYLLAFISNHCPFVINLADEFASIANQAQEKGISVAAINCNDVSRYPEDHPDLMDDFSQAHQFEFPYLFDESQQVPITYSAVCTPDFFLFDEQGLLVYRGQFDTSRPGNGVKPTGQYLQKAIDTLLAGKPALENQLPSIGCSIKWLPENG